MSERGRNRTPAAAQGEAAVGDRGRPSTGVSLLAKVLVPGPLGDGVPPPRDLDKVVVVDEIPGGVRARGHGLD